MARLKGDLHFLPDRVEAIGGDGINHRNERLAPRQAGVRLVDEVEGCVVLNEGPFSSRREFHELDCEQVVVVIGGYCAGRTASACCPRGCRQHQCQTCPGDELGNVLFHSFDLVWTTLVVYTASPFCPRNGNAASL